MKREGLWFALALNERGKMIACAFSEDSQKRAESAIIASVPLRERHVRRTTALTSSKLRELHDLYMGRRKTDLRSLDLSNVSPFRRQVYLLLSRIPRGRVTTYGAIAKKITSRRYARAVGTAVGSNPMPLAIPCHRVVTSTLRVENYGMPGRKPSEGAHVKRRLLEREGVKFKDGKISEESFWSPN
jgi:methylated-DNA-[protein]-cysteine S-methyltransferase